MDVAPMSCPDGSLSWNISYPLVLSTCSLMFLEPSEDTVDVPFETELTTGFYSWHFASSGSWR